MGIERDESFDESSVFAHFSLVNAGITRHNGLEYNYSLITPSKGIFSSSSVFFAPIDGAVLSWIADNRTRNERGGGFCRLR
jgi:hypothetical protein